MIRKKKLIGMILDKLECKNVGIQRSDSINKIFNKIDDLYKEKTAYKEGLKDQNENIEIILGNLNVGVIASDCGGEILFCNSLAKDFFKISSDEIVNLRDFVRNKVFLKKIEIAKEQNKIVEFDYNVDNEIYNVKINPIMGRKGAKLLIFISNVTEVRKVSIEKEQFFENASHELNTPLTAILGYTDLLLEEKNYKEAFLKKIKKQAQKMDNLIKDMMTISYLDSEEKMDFEFIDLKAVVCEIIDDFRLRAKEKKIVVTSRFEGECKLLSNEMCIRTVLVNLLDNAIKYNKKNGYVEVTLRETKNNITLTIEDNGIGIDEKYLPRVTERFFRTERARELRETGTGLGLSIVKNILSILGATYTISSKLDVGTKINVKFKKQKNSNLV